MCEIFSKMYIGLHVKYLLFLGEEVSNPCNTRISNTGITKDRHWKRSWASSTHLSSHPKAILMSSSSLPPPFQKLRPSFEHSWFLRHRAGVPMRKPVMLMFYVHDFVGRIKEERTRRGRPSVILTQQNMRTYGGNGRTNPRRSVSRTGSFTAGTDRERGWMSHRVGTVVWRKQ